MTAYSTAYTAVTNQIHNQFRSATTRRTFEAIASEIIRDTRIQLDAGLITADYAEAVADVLDELMQ